jgi:hypothetical protein
LENWGSSIMRLLKYLIRNQVLKSSGKYDAEDGRSGEKSSELDQGRGYEFKKNLSDIVKE